MSRYIYQTTPWASNILITEPLQKPVFVIPEAVFPEIQPVTDKNHGCPIIDSGMTDTLAKGSAYIQIRRRIRN